jgi:hypothetical protein
MSRNGLVRAHRVDVPPEIAHLNPLVEPNYAEGWQVERSESDVRSPEQWARAIFEGAPRAAHAFLEVGWKLGLLLQLGPRNSEEYVFGWKIETNNPEVIVFGVHSALVGNASFVLCLQDSQVVLANFVRFERRGAGAIWASVLPIHRRMVPYVLTRGASTH